MDISNLMALVNAGFTKDEIFSLIKPEEKAPKAEEKAPKQEEKAPKAEEKAPKQEEKANDAIAALGAKVDYLVNRLNYIAVQGSKQPENTAETVDDILAKMI